jgi:hypothetical protein
MEVEVRKKEKAKSFDTALSIRADWRLVKWGALAIARKQAIREAQPPSETLATLSNTFQPVCLSPDSC